MKKAMAVVLMVGMLVMFIISVVLQGCSVAQGAAMAPQSHYTWIQKVRDGVVFQETFENDNFINADGWTVLQGNPANSEALFNPGGGQNQSFAGIMSWDNQALVPGTSTQSLPVASVAITDTNVDQQWCVQVWFYDTMDTTSPGPYFKIKLSDGTYFSVGVRNSVSTIKYSVSAVSTGADAPTTPSFSGTRSVGWHSFFIYPSLTSENLFLSIDGNIQSPAGSSNSIIISNLYLCADVIGGPGPSFGYFDQLGYYRNEGFKILPATATATVYDISNVEQTVSTGPDNMVYLNWGNIVFPFPGFLEFNQPGSAHTLLVRTCLTNFNPGDIYLLTDLAFGRKFGKPDLVDTGLVSRNQTNVGVQEVLNYGLKDQLTTTIQRLLGETWKKQIDNWFQYAITGAPYSIMTDDVHGNALGIASSFVQGGTSPTLSVMPNLCTNPTDVFNVGLDYVIRDQANTQKQTATLLSKTTTTLTFDNNLAFDTNAPDGQGNYDMIYSKYFFPFMELGENNLQGLILSDARYPYYDWTQRIQEYNS